MRFRMALGFGFGLALTSLPVAGGTWAAGYNVQILSFDMWCLENKRYEPERCDARRPDDVAAFEQYRATVERYELPYLKRMEEERELQTRILDHDSSDRAPGR
jgi:hypothetical protein